MITVQIREGCWLKKLKYSNKWKAVPELKGNPHIYNTLYVRTIVYIENINITTVNMFFLIDWIMPDHSSIFFAKCKFANKRLKAKCSTLKDHSKSKQHLKIVN